jgi:hypothetical protein
VTAFLWTLVVVLALGRLLYVVGRKVSENARAGAASLEAPRFDVFTFDALPPAVARKLAPLRAGFLALGFRDLVSYSRRGPRTNHTTVLLSADGRTAAHVWLARHQGTMLWLTVLAGWRAFQRELAASPRYGLITEYPGLRRFETSPVEILATMTVAGELEFLVVSESTPLAEAAQHHEAGARAFAARTNLEALPVETAEQLFEIQRGIMARMAVRLRPSTR